MPSIRGLVLFASLGCAIQLQFAVTLSSTPKSGKLAIAPFALRSTIDRVDVKRLMDLNPVYYTVYDILKSLPSLVGWLPPRL